MDRDGEEGGEDTVIDYLTDLVNATGTLPVTAKANYLSKTGDVSASVAGMAGVETKTYIDGSGIVEQPFAVYLRVPERRVETDLDAAGILANLAIALMATEPDGDVLAVTSAPTPDISGRDGKGDVFWRLDGVIRYKRGTVEVS